ncbi:glycosyltransferase family 4 protein [Corynebacterium casei]|uniref:glycosyltransferase family 4 protein n=1 Tax=Corynebacterium casei TaxID=160386 RepID=UPI003FD25BA0
MRILVISQYWNPENGVPQRRWTWLSRILVDAGHEVKVVAPPPHYERAITFKEWFDGRIRNRRKPVEIGKSGESIVRTSYLPAGRSLTSRISNQAYVAFASLVAIAFRRQSLRGFQPDIIIGTVPALPTAVVTLFASRRLKAPYVIDLRDAWPELLDRPEQWNRATGSKSMRERALSHGPLQLTTWMTRKALDVSLEKANGIMLTSSYLRESFLVGSGRRFDKFSAPKMEVIRNVFPPETAFNHSLVTADFGRPFLNVLYAGTIGRAQNLNNAIEAVEIANNSGANVSLRLVGAGATKSELSRLVKERNVSVSIESRHPADGLESLYQWADTALVHLSSWEPLQRAVPSKTYELMESGIHISGVVAGETAEVISHLKSGDVVAPDNPAALAKLWTELAFDRKRLNVASTGADWVREERSQSRMRFLNLLESIFEDE